MINIDDRLLTKVNQDELWLLCHIAKRINKTNTCWPSNRMLCRETGWAIEKLQKIKKSLSDKNLMKVLQRRHPEGGQGANMYQIKTDLIGIFVKLSSLEPLSENPISEDDTPLGKNGSYPPENPTTEVLTNEVLISSIAESKDSAYQKALFEDNSGIEDRTTETIEDRSTEREKKKEKKNKKEKEKIVEPEFQAFVDIWFKRYPTVGLGANRALGGRMINELIRQTKEQIKVRNWVEGTEQNIQFWQIFVDNLGKTWADGSDLKVINSNYPSLIYQIEHGGKSFNQRKVQQNTATQMFSKYAFL